jgi:poly-beta-hydroxyalkanoate depolymerase
VCHERMERIVPGRHELHVFPNYGHQDPFMGEHVARDIFPRLVEFIEKHRYDVPSDTAPEVHAAR